MEHRDAPPATTRSGLPASSDPSEPHARSVLYVAYRAPYPPDKGERIRMFHQVRGLARRMKVHLVYPSAGFSSPPPGPLAELCASVHVVAEPRMPLLAEAMSLAAGRPRAAGRYHTRRLLATVRQVLATRPVDVVLASTVHMGPVVLALPGVPRVMDMMDVYSEVWRAVARTRRRPRAWFDGWEGTRLTSYESHVARSVDTTVFVSEAEADLFRRRHPGAHIAVVPNGVDLEWFTPRPRARDRQPGTVVFVGTMDYPPNDDAARHLIEAIVPRIPEVHRPRVLIVGRNPTRALLGLAAAPAVVVTGEVPDVRPHLARGRVAVAPFRMGRGVQNKVLEAMAMGLPVVASPLGAEGIDAGPGDGLIVAADDEAFASALGDLLAAPDTAAALGSRARAFVEAHHRWDTATERLARVLDAAVRGVARGHVSAHEVGEAHGP